MKWQKDFCRSVEIECTVCDSTGRNGCRTRVAHQIHSCLRGTLLLASITLKCFCSIYGSSDPTTCFIASEQQWKTSDSLGRSAWWALAASWWQRGSSSSATQMSKCRPHITRWHGGKEEWKRSYHVIWSKKLEEIWCISLGTVVRCLTFNPRCSAVLNPSTTGRFSIDRDVRNSISFIIPWNQYEMEVRFVEIVFRWRAAVAYLRCEFRNLLRVL